MKQLRTALGVSIFCLAGLTGSAPAHADILEIQIDNTSITATLPAAGIVEYFFTGSITNTSTYELNFESSLPNANGQFRGISFPSMFQGPAPSQNPLTYTDPIFGSPTSGGLLSQPLFGSCNWGAQTSSMCLAAGTTFTGAIASVIVGSDSLPGIYAVTQDGAGHPASIIFRGSYFQDGQEVFFTQKSPELSVSVVSEHAVPELKTWALVVAGLAGVVLIGSKRTRI
jgi:hypothetical protein